MESSGGLPHRKAGNSFYLSSMYKYIYKLDQSLTVQAMPIYFRWFYSINPIAWALYGIIVTQLGDITGDVALPDGGAEDLQTLLITTFDYHYSFRGWVVAILLGFAVFFAAIAVLCLKVLKFQRR